MANGGAPPGSATSASSLDESTASLPASQRLRSAVSQPHRIAPWAPTKRAPKQLDTASSDASARSRRWPPP
eukprot:1466384-Prymnesium_polylepis.1